MRDIATKIDRVTLYRNGALVVRRGSGTKGTVRMGGLPLLLASDSLRVRASAGGIERLIEGVVVEGVDTGEAPTTIEKRRLTQEIARLSDERMRVEAEIEVLAAVAPVPLASIDEPRVVDTAAWLPLSRTMTERILERRARAVALSHELVAKEKELARVVERERAPATPPRFFRAVVVELTEDAELELEYFVSAARFVPTYALHVRERSAELVIAAMVAQATGEPWDDVALSFSTADLARDTTVPELTSWRIGRAQPTPRRGFRPLPSDLPSLFVGFDAVRGVAPAPPPPSPTRSTRGLDTVPHAMTFERGAPPPPALAPLGEALYDDEPTGAGEAAEVNDEDADTLGFVEEATPSVSREEMADLARSSKAAPAAAPMARTRGGGGPSSSVTAVAAPLPPRLRYASTRLAGPDEALRGKLVPLDVMQELAWFVEAHDVHAVDALRRAVLALRDAEQRLWLTPLPPHTRALSNETRATVFSSSTRHSIPDDGAFFRVEAERHTAGATFEHRAVPRMSSDVYRFCVLSSGARALPFGPLAVFEDGVYRVTTTLEQREHERAALELNLGVDPDVRVLGRAAHVQQDEKGLVSQTSRVTHTVKTTIRSTAKSHVDVMVFDRLPVPEEGEKDVKVELVDAKPPAKRSDKGPDGAPLDGALSWRVVVQPGATETIEARYVVELPSKRELVGGNRRE